MASSPPYFIRHQMGDSPGNNGGTWSACPDIIISTSGAPNYTPQPLDPATLITAAGYGTDFGSYVQVSPQGTVQNFVYLRALNTNPGANIPTRLWLMYTESDMALWPQNWKSSNIMVGDAHVSANWQDGQHIISGGPGPYVATGQPFLWAPQNPNPGTHYCVISMAEPFPGATAPDWLTDPAQAPPPSVGYMGSFDQLVAFVLGNDWFGWRNTIDVTTYGPTWEQTIPVTGPDQAGQCYVGFACSNMPTDGFVAAYMAGPNAANSLNVPKTAITSTNMNYTVPVNLPAKFSTNMIISYWQGAIAPPAGSNITPVLAQQSTTVERLLAGRPSVRAPGYFRVFDNVSNEFKQWRRMHVFGSVPLMWSTPPSEAKGLISVPRQFDEVLPSLKDNGATWQISYPLAIPGGLVFVGYQCTNMPADGSIAMDVASPAPMNSASLPPTQIMKDNQTVGINLAWPECPEGTLTLSYYQGATPPPADATVQPVMWEAGGASSLRKETDAPTWQRTVPVAGADQSEKVYIGVQCTNMPTDGFLAFSLDPDGVSCPKTAISAPNLTIYYPFDLPAQYQGELTMDYWQGATPPPAGATISPLMYLSWGVEKLGSFKVGK